MVTCLGQQCKVYGHVLSIWSAKIQCWTLILLMPTGLFPFSTNSDYAHVTCIVILICFNTHGAIKSSQELVETCLCIPEWIGIWKCWFLRRGENWSTQRKTSRSKGENQQQTQSTYGINTRIWITTLVWQASALTTAPPWFNFKWWKWDFQSPRLPRDNSIIPFLAAPGFLRIYELPAEDEWTTDNLDFLKVLEFFSGDLVEACLAHFARLWQVDMSQITTDNHNTWEVMRESAFDWAS